MVVLFLMGSKIGKFRILGMDSASFRRMAMAHGAYIFISSSERGSFATRLQGEDGRERGAAHRLCGVAVGSVFNMPYFGASGVSVPPKGVSPSSLLPPPKQSPPPPPLWQWQ